jgi:hypothetical protein
MSKVHTLPKAPAAAPALVSKVIVMTYLRSTPGTHVYSTDSDTAACTQVYLKKSQIGDDAPKTITLKVEFET